MRLGLLLATTILAAATAGSAGAQFDPLAGGGAPIAAPAAASSQRARVGTETWLPPVAGAPPEIVTALPRRGQPPPTLLPGENEKYDGLGRWDYSRRLPLTEYPASKLIEVVDGTPRYEVPENRSQDNHPSVKSGLFPTVFNSMLPKGSGPLSPRVGDLDVSMEYLVKFWLDWPDAKMPGDDKFSKGSGAVLPMTFRNDFGVPADVRAELTRQADIIFNALMQAPYIKRSQGVMIGRDVEFLQAKDDAGVTAYGFDASFRILWLDSSDPNARQGPDGRWTTKSAGGARLVVRVNNFARMEGGERFAIYRGNPVKYAEAGHLIEVLATDRPSVVPYYKTGEGDMIRNPAFFDPAAPKTQIQRLEIETLAPFPQYADALNGGKYNPMDPLARVAAAPFYVNWISVVNQINGPSAPRAR